MHLLSALSEQVARGQGLARCEQGWQSDASRFRGFLQRVPAMFFTCTSATSVQVVCAPEVADLDRGFASRATHRQRTSELKTTMLRTE
jgi:hypothetical protein